MSGLTVAWVLRVAYAAVVIAGLGVLTVLSLHREMTSESLWDSSGKPG